MLDLNKKYVTTEGFEVIGLTYIPFNSAGLEVTFPFKGSVKIPGKRSCVNKIWTKEGKESIFKNTKWDLIEEKTINKAITNE